MQTPVKVAYPFVSFVVSRVMVAFTTTCSKETNFQVQSQIFKTSAPNFSTWILVSYTKTSFDLCLRHSLGSPHRRRCVLKQLSALMLESRTLSGHPHCEPNSSV